MKQGYLYWEVSVGSIGIRADRRQVTRSHPPRNPAAGSIIAMVRIRANRIEEVGLDEQGPAGPAWWTSNHGESPDRQGRETLGIVNRRVDVAGDLSTAKTAKQSVASEERTKTNTNHGDRSGLPNEVSGEPHLQDDFPG